MTNSILTTDRAEIRFRPTPRSPRRAFVRSTPGKVYAPVFGVDFAADSDADWLPAVFPAGGR